MSTKLPDKPFQRVPMRTIRVRGVTGCCRQQEDTKFTASQVQERILGISKHSAAHVVPFVLRAMTLAIFACCMRCNAPSHNEDEISRAGLSTKTPVNKAEKRTILNQTVRVELRRLKFAGKQIQQQKTCIKCTCQINQT